MSSHTRTANLLGATALAICERMQKAMSAACQCGGSGPAALVTLLDDPGIGVSEIGRRIGLSQPATARLVAALVSQNLIERRPGGDDRSVSLRLSRQGARAARRTLMARQQVIGSFVDHLDRSERAALARALERILGELYAEYRSEHLICRLCDREACVAGDDFCPVGRAAREDSE